MREEVNDIRIEMKKNSLFANYMIVYIENTKTILFLKINKRMLKVCRKKTQYIKIFYIYNKLRKIF